MQSTGLNEPGDGDSDKQHVTLEQLRQLLSHDEEQGLIRAQAIDAQVDRILCWRISCTIPQLATGVSPTSSSSGATSLSTVPIQTAFTTSSTSTLDRTALILTLECLALLWTKPSTTERRKETRRQGVDLCNGLLLIWQNFPSDEKLVQAIRLILKSWTKLCKDDAAVRQTLIRQSNLVSFLGVQLDQTITSTSTTTQIPSSCPPSGYLALMKHVVFRAENGSQKEFLFQQWNDVVVRCVLPSRGPNSSGGIIWTATTDVKNECVDAASAILWNWASWGPLARNMAKSHRMWETMRELLDYSRQSDQLAAQRNVLSTIGTIISCFSGNKQELMLQDDRENYQVVGAVAEQLQQQTWILSSCIDIVQETSDTDSRRRCLRTIRCLSSSTWGRLFMQSNTAVSKDKPLLALLLQVLRRPETDSNIHIQVCQTIVSLSPCCSEDWIKPWIPHFQVALIQKVQDTQTEKGLLTAALSALSSLCNVMDNFETLEVLGWKGEDSYSTAFYKQLTTLLSTRYSDDVDFHQTVAEFLNSLVLYDNQIHNHVNSAAAVVDEDIDSMNVTNSQQMEAEELGTKSAAAKSPPSSDCCFSNNFHAVQLFCLLLSPTNPEFERSQQVTIDTLGQLVHHHRDSRNRKALADHEDLLTGVVNLCLLTTIKGTTKDEAKRIILALVPEL